MHFSRVFGFLFFIIWLALGKITTIQKQNKEKTKQRQNKTKRTNKNLTSPYEDLVKSMEKKF